MALSLFLFRYSNSTNRGNQSSGGEDSVADQLKNIMATYITTVWVVVLVMTVLFYTGLVGFPDMSYWSAYY
jgi:hypothetical protein